MLLQRDKPRPGLEFVEVAAFADIGFVDQAFGDDHMGQGHDQRDIGSRLQGQMIGRLDMRRAHQVDAARIGDDQFAPARNRFFMREAKTGWASVGLAPMTRMTSALSTDLKSWVPAEVPSVLLRP